MYIWTILDEQDMFKFLYDKCISKRITSELYKLEAYLQDIKQGDLPVSKYVFQLIRIWQ